MSEPRISFGHTPRSCTVCGEEPGPDREPLVDLTFPQPPAVLPLCTSCAARIRADGPPPPPVVPEFRFAGPLRLPIATADDLRALLRAVAAAAPEAEVVELLERSHEPRLADHEAWAKRIAGRPRPLDVAGLLVTAALLGLEPEPVERMRALVDSARGSDELTACFGAYCARSAGADEWRPGSERTSREQRLLEAADRSLLFATLPSGHPLAQRMIQIRAGVALALGKTGSVDRLLELLGRDDPRAQLLRGLRAVQQDLARAADREFRAAAEHEFVGFDPEIGAAAAWNRAARALSATRFDEARDALRTYCRLRPDDVPARIVLGHAYFQSELHAVAREVVGDALEREALEHVRGIAEDTGLAPALRTEGVLLHASCLLRIGEAREARRLVERELDSGRATGERRTELARLAAQCALRDGEPEVALAHLAEPWATVRSAAVAHEVASAAAAAARDRIDLHGLQGLFQLVESYPWIGAALRKHYGALHTFLCASHALQQVRGELRPHPSFGMDWSWIGAQGANVQTSLFQAYDSLARHQLPAALRHDLSAQTAGAAAVPFATLAALLEASRTAAPDERERLVLSLNDIAQSALRDLPRH